MCLLVGCMTYFLVGYFMKWARKREDLPVSSHDLHVIMPFNSKACESESRCLNEAQSIRLPRLNVDCA